MRLLPTLVITALVASGCHSVPDTTPNPSRPLEGVLEPLSRIPVRQDVIAGLAPESKPILEQVKGTKDDVTEAKQGLEQAETENGELKEALAKEKTETNKQYQQKIGWLRLLCIAGIGAGVLLSVFASKKFLVITFAAIAMLVAIAVEGFIYTYAMPIAAGVLVVILLMLAYEKFIKHRANKELVATGEIMKKKLNGTWEDVKKDIVQSKTTQKIVDKFQGK
jgi:hypothetical protein